MAIKPDNADTHTSIGPVLEDPGRVDEATTQYRQALEIDPGYAEAHYNPGLALADRGQLDKAIAHYQEVLGINPDFLEACRSLEIV
jgi:tetratricopeptide (TPR) repeat protein